MTARLSLAARILLGVAIALLPVVALLVFNSVTDYRLRRREVLHSQLLPAQALASFADSLFDEALADALSIATVPEVSSLERARAEPYLEKVQQNFPHYDALALFDGRGRMVAASKPETRGTVDVANRAYFLEVQRTGKPVLSDLLVSRLTGQPIVVAAAPLLDERQRVRGVLLVTLAAEQLSAHLSVPGLTGGPISVVLYSPEGLVAFHSSFPGLPWEQRTRPDFWPLAVTQRDGSYAGEYTSPLYSEPRLGALARSPKFGWVVAVTRSTSDAFTPLRRAVRYRTVAFLAVVLLSIALTRLVTRRLVRPLAELTAQTEALAAGRFDGRVPVTSADELGALAAAFNRMAAQLSESHAAQHRSLGELRAVLDSVDAAILVVDSSRRVRYLNRHMSEWFGVDEASGLGRDLRELFAERIAPLLADPEEVMGRLDEECGLREPFAQQPVELLGPRQRSLLRYCAPVLDERGAPLGRVEAFHDVTELRRTERMRDEFLSAAAHELKTPITAIKGFAQLLLRDPEKVSVSGRPLLETIDRQCDRLRHLADDLLQVARLRVGRLSISVERVDLAALGRAALERWQSLAPRNPIALEAPAPVWIDADPYRITQILDNLVDNAVKYSPAGTPIEVRVDEAEGAARLSVRDRGFGIPAAKQGRIFEPFFRAHTGTPEDAAGLGIGLFLSQHIAQQHGGSLGFTSVPGEGTTFSLTLPLAPARAGPG